MSLSLTVTEKRQGGNSGCCYPEAVMPAMKISLRGLVLFCKHFDMNVIDLMVTEIISINTKQLKTSFNLG